MRKKRSKYLQGTLLLIIVAVVALFLQRIVIAGNFDFRQQAYDAEPVPVGVQGNWTMIFEDDFTGTALDTSKWSTCYYYACTGWWHLERQWYQPQNVVVSDGTLKLVAKKETIRPGDGNTYEFSSGMVQSGQTKTKDEQPKFKFQYGYLEGRIKVPKGTAYWPAFWTTGSFEHPPELDLFEYFSNTSELSQGFWYWENGNKKSWNGGSNLKGQEFANEWHTYGVDWDPNYIAFYFDGQLVKKYEGPIMAQPEVHKEQHIILNFAVGASFLPAPDQNTPNEAAMEVDYVRVWKRGTDLSQVGPSPTPLLQISPSPVVVGNCTGDGVYLYGDGDYRGTCHKLTANASNLASTPIGSDKVSSVKVVGPYAAKLFSDAEFKGTLLNVSASLPTLVGQSVGNDQASSIQVAQLVSPVPTPSVLPSPTPVSSVRPLPTPVPTPVLSPVPSPSSTTSTECTGDGIYLYADGNYQGRCAKLVADNPDLRSTTVGGDSVSSVRVMGPYQATLYADSNFAGTASIVTTSLSSLSTTSVKNDAASSIKVSMVQPPSDLLKISEIQLINEQTNKVIKTYRGNEMNSIMIDRNEVPSFTLAAVANKAVGSIKFQHGNRIHIENVAPYGIAGDLFGDFAPWNPGLGTTTLTITPYTKSSAKGTAGQSVQTTVTVR